MHVEEKVKVRCLVCQKEFESNLEFYFDSWFVCPFCSDSCRNRFFEARKHGENCQCPRCTKGDISD